MNYDDLKTLDELRRNGAISEEEYQKEKEKFFQRTENSNPKDLLGMSERTYITLMHLSQLCGFLIPLILWIINKDKNERIDAAGRHIINFMLSWLIYISAATVLCILLVGIPLLIAIGITQVVFIIIATVKASRGEVWSYPLCLKLLK